MPEFDEISHTGGTVTIRRKGGAYQLGVSHFNPHAMAMIQIAVGLDGQLLGIMSFDGVELSDKHGRVGTRPYLLTYLFSDCEGLFGRTCRNCIQYFRTTAVSADESWCPYCVRRDTSLAFLTKNQLQYLETFVNAILEAPEGETVVNLDRLINGLSANGSAWVYVEERQ